MSPAQGPSDDAEWNALDCPKLPEAYGLSDCAYGAQVIGNISQSVAPVM